MQFNEQKLRTDLKKSLGFETVPDDELKNHQIIINSPTGGCTELSLSVKDYIDTEVRISRDAYEQLDFDMNNTEIPDIATSTENFIVGDTATSNLGVDNIKYFDISFQSFNNKTQENEIKNYTVALSFNPNDPKSVQQFVDQSNQIKSHFTFLKEKSRFLLLGIETIISYYQYVNLVSNLVNPNPPSIEDVSGMIADKMSMIFGGAEDLDAIKKQFGF